MKDKLRKAGPGLLKEIEAALYKEVEIDATEVKRRTPVGPTGNLRASVHTVGPLRSGGQKTKIYMLIVAGGPSATYAIYVHEDPDAFHKVGQWKFLESVILESRPYMAARIAKRVSLARALAG